MNIRHHARNQRSSHHYSVGQISTMVALAVAVVYVIAVACTSPSSPVLKTIDWLALQGFWFLNSWGLHFRSAEFVFVFVFGTVQWFTIAFAWTWMALSLRRGMGRRRVKQVV